MQIIPFKDPSSFVEQVTLSGTIFILMFNWNSLNEFWTMDIRNRDEEPIVLGIKIVPNYPLLAQYTETNLPLGEIVCQNIVKSPDVIRRFDIGQNFLLVYYEPGELEEATGL